MLSEEVKEVLNNLSGRPIFVAVFFQIAGIIVANHYSSEISFTLLLVLFVFWIIAVFVGVLKSFVISLLTMMTGAFFLGWIALYSQQYPQLQDDHFALNYANQRITIEARLLSSAERGKKTTHLHLGLISCKAKGVNKTECSGKLIVYVKDKNIPWRAGDIVKLTTTIRTTGSSGNPGEFDYASYLARRGFFARSYLRSASSIKILQSPKDVSTRIKLEQVRADIANWIEQKSDPKYQAVFKALLLGMRKEIPEQIRNTFLSTGTAHLLAISGLHLGVMALWIFLVVQRLWRLNTSWLRYISANQAAGLVTLPMTWLYALLAGLHVATFRAALMISIYLTAHIITKKADSLNSLFLAAFTILIITPYAIFEAGFQLSFSAVLAIILVVPRLTESLPKTLRQKMFQKKPQWKILNYMYFLAASSLACFVFTAPIVASWFHVITFYGVIWNLIIVPVFSLLIIPLLSLVVIFWLLGALSLAELLLVISQEIFSLIYNLMNSIVEFAGGLIYIPNIPWITTWLFLGGLILFLFTVRPPKGFRGRPDTPLLINKRVVFYKRLVATSMIFISILLVFLALLNTPKPENNFRAYVPHLKEGTSTLVIDSQGNSDLISPGRMRDDKSDVTKRNLAPLLWSLGISTLDRLWLVSGSDSESRAADKLKTFVKIKNKYYVRKISNCKQHGKLVKCNKENVAIWKLPDKREDYKYGVPVLAFTLEEAILLVIPSPHRIAPEAWKLLAANLQKKRVAVIQFGPGNIESFREMILQISPISVTFAMNRYLSRFISRDTWETMKSIFPETTRTDHDKAIGILKNGSAVKLSNPDNAQTTVD